MSLQTTSCTSEFFLSTAQLPERSCACCRASCPKTPKKRKARKADFEVLTLLPRFAGCPHGALLALGSGSRPNRRRGVLVPLDRAGAVDGSPRVIDLSGLYRGLEKQLGELNVEGAVVLGQHLCLLNRGHPRQGGSAVVWLRLPAVLRGIASRDAIDVAALHGCATTIWVQPMACHSASPTGLRCPVAASSSPPLLKARTTATKTGRVSELRSG